MVRRSRGRLSTVADFSSKEYFADYVPINPALFSLNYSTPPMRLWSRSPNEWDPAALERHTNGLVALLLSLKKRPVVRYERMSGLAKKLGEEVHVSVPAALLVCLTGWRAHICHTSIRCSQRFRPSSTFGGQTRRRCFSYLTGATTL